MEIAQTIARWIFHQPSLLLPAAFGAFGAFGAVQIEADVLSVNSTRCPTFHRLSHCTAIFWVVQMDEFYKPWCSRGNIALYFTFAVTVLGYVRLQFWL